MIKDLCNIFTRYKTEKKGATAVEFALIALPFLMMIFGVMETSRVLWVMNSVEYVTRDTGRYAALNSDLSDAEFQTYATDILGNMNVRAQNFNLTSTTLTSNAVDFIEIDVAYNVETLFSGFIPYADLNFQTSVRRPIIE